MSLNNYTENIDKMQPKEQTEAKINRFKNKKENSLKVSNSMKRIHKKARAIRIKECGTHLVFRICKNDGNTILVRGNFCRDRMCGMCNWRRSLRLVSDIIKILHRVEEKEKLNYLFLTLTDKRVNGLELEEHINKFFNGYKLLLQRKLIKNVVVGFIRVLEITYDKEMYITKEMYRKKKNYFSKKGLNVGDENPEYDTYYCHFHVLIGVKPSYFKNNYIKREMWSELWKKSLKVDYDVNVDIRRVKPKKNSETIDMKKAVLETAKYSVKDTDYIIENQEDMDKVVEVLASALHRRRLVAFGKLFLEVKKELKIKDIEDKNADLSDEEKEQKEKDRCKCAICGSDMIETLYKWKLGVSNYIKIRELKKGE